jgi:tetratricopeptide (TPR) repeat protein
MRSKVVRGLLVALIAFVVWVGYEFIQMQNGLARATDLARFGLWEKARSALEEYLQLHPADAEARLLMANLWINDDGLPGYKTAPEAIVHLERIPASSVVAERARILKGRMQFFILHKPAAAEKLFEEAIQQDENNREAYQLLCTVYEMTGRFHDIERFFWRTYELAPQEERAVQLRYWYMSQFFPLTANDNLDRLMGFHDAATKSQPVEAVRYMSFRDTEPNEPLGRAGLASWMRRIGKPREALEVLRVSEATAENELQNVFYVTILIDLLIDLGEYEQAEARFQNWPGENENFNYWRLKAILAEQSGRDLAAALEAYDKALEIWPGPADWRLMHRKAGCLAQSRRTQEAVAMRARAETVEKLMENSVHERLRYILGFLDNPDHLREVADFYRKLGREREGAAWLREAGSRIADTLK